MKRFVPLALLVLFLLMSGASFASAQESVAQAARAARARKKAAAQKVYTNDDIAPAQIPAAETTPSTASTEGQAALTPKAEKSDRSTPDEAANDEQTAQKTAEKYKQDIAALKTEIAGMEHEIDLMQREHQVRVAVYYADAGVQLRDSQKWFEDEKKYNDDLAAKQNALAEAKQKLDGMSEQARKAGVPPRDIE